MKWGISPTKLNIDTEGVTPVGWTMSKELVALDLDGTLMDEGKTTDRNKKALMSLISRGVPVVPATTRMRFSTTKLIREIPVDKNPLVCTNGARVMGPGWMDHEDHDDWFESRLDQNVAEQILSFIDEKDYEITSVFKEKKYWRRRRDQKEGSFDVDTITRLVDKNIKALENGPPISLMMHSDGNGKDGLKEVEEYSLQFSEKVRLDRHHRDGEWLSLTVYPGGISKRKGLEIVCDELDIPMKNVMAVGDDEVDMGMLEGAGLGIAMGNAPDHVKEVADEVAPRCKEDGVEWAIENFVL